MAIPVLLFAFPSAREKMGSFFLAMKTVPLGCLTMLVVPSALVGLVLTYRSGGGFQYGGAIHDKPLVITFFILGILAGIGVIVFLCSKLKGYYFYSEKSSIIVFFLVFHFFVFSYGVFKIATPFVCNLFFGQNFQKNWATIVMPKEGDTELAFQSRSIHIFLAEYDYRLCFTKDGRKIYRNLMTNTGGKIHVNIYRLDDGRLYFHERYLKYIVDPVNATVFVFIRHETEKSYFAGDISDLSDGGDFENGGFSYITTEDGTVTFYCGEKIREVITIDKEALNRAEYYGCILADGFYPATEKSMMPIDDIYKKQENIMKESAPLDEATDSLVE